MHRRFGISGVELCDDHRRQREEEERRDRVMANEILRYREALRLLAKAIGWAEAGAPFGLFPPGPLWRPRQTSKGDVVPPAA